MNFLFLSTYDSGGAAAATLRIHRALLANGHQSAVLVKDKTSNDPSIIALSSLTSTSPGIFASKIFQRITRKFKRASINTEKEYHFYNLDEPDHSVDFSKHVNKLPFKPDVIIACWISKFLNSAAIASLQKATGARAYFWGVDMSPLTGGCHYAWECEGYTKTCNNCPAIINKKYADQPAYNLSFKKKHFGEARLNFIAGSNSLLIQSQRSSLFSKQHSIKKVLMCIPSTFNPYQRDSARSTLGIAHDRQVIFYGSTFTSEKRKGLRYFIESLRQLEVLVGNNIPLQKKLLILIVGNQLKEDIVKELGVSFEVKVLGFVNGDEKLAALYKASNVFVCSSIEDSGPMMINESVMCGTPVVCFDIGVAPDLVENGLTGYRVPLYNVPSMAEGIYHIIKLNHEEFDVMSVRTAKTALERTSSSIVVSNLLNAVS